MLKSIAHDTVDAIQNGKKQFVATIIKHDKLAETMNKFIDAQAQYTKDAINTMVDATTSFGMLVTDKSFYKDLADAYGVDKLVPASFAGTKAKSKKVA